MTDSRNNPPATNAKRCTCDVSELYHSGCHYSECPLVACDSNCGALKDPKTKTQLLAAVNHWRGHRYLNGCSHAN